MRVRLGQPRAGWIALTISDGSGVAWTEAVSAVPSDPIRALTDLAGAAADGLSARAELHLEPDALVLSVDDQGLEVRRVSRTRPITNTLLLTVNGSSIDIAAAIWRGLRDLESRFEVGSWPHPFPHGGVAHLSRLRVLRTGSAS